MGEFFTSPYQRASQNIFDMTTRGTSPFDAAIGNMKASALTTNRQLGSQMSEGISKDILSTAKSSGVTFTSGITDALGEAKSKVGENTQVNASKINTAALDAQLGALKDALTLGLGGLSKSSTFGDLAAGLQYMANLGAGVATMGGSSGFGWWGKRVR